MVGKEDSRIVIQADKDLEDLIPGYLENRRLDIETIELLLLSRDYPAIERLGHAMKGSGGGYGFDEITRLGSGLEQSAKENNRDAITAFLTALADYLDRVEVVYG